MDHNRLRPQFTESNPNATVVGVIDHHNDEGLYTTAKPRTIQVPTGSCTSLVALHMQKTRGDNFTIPVEVATLLLTGVLIDTGGLKKGGKAVKEDHEAAAFLIPRSVVSPSTPDQVAVKFSKDMGAPTPNKIKVKLSKNSDVRKLSDELEEKKTAVESLTIDELLRRDYKQYDLHSSWTPDNKVVTVGLATVMLSLEYCIDRDPTEFWEGIDTFMDERHLDVLGILTTFKEKERHWTTPDAHHIGKQVHGKKGRREALFVVRDFAEGGIEERLWTGLESSSACGFIIRQFEEFTSKDVSNGGVGARKARAYEQSHADQTRKAIAPLMKRIIEGSTEDED